MIGGVGLVEASGVTSTAFIVQYSPSRVMSGQNVLWSCLNVTFSLATFVIKIPLDFVQARNNFFPMLNLFMKWDELFCIFLNEMSN
jgi:hypothetical protein